MKFTIINKVISVVKMSGQAINIEIPLTHSRGNTRDVPLFPIDRDEIQGGIIRRPPRERLQKSEV